VTPEERQQIEQRIDLDAIRRRWCTPHDKGSAHQAVVEALCGEVRRLLDEVDRQAAEARILRDETNRFGTAMFAAEELAARLSSAIEAHRETGERWMPMASDLALWAVLGGEPAPPPPAPNPADEWPTMTTPDPHASGNKVDG
jgi:hypothetical protein